MPRQGTDALRMLAEGRLSRAHRLSRIRGTGEYQAEPPKLITPAANTFAPAAVS